MTIQYYRKSVYGEEKMYIATQVQAEIVSCLTNKKTISQGDIICLQKLGCKFVEILAPKTV